MVAWRRGHYIVAKTIMDRLMQNPAFRQAYVAEKAFMDVAQIYAGIMKRRGWTVDQLAHEMDVNPEYARDTLQGAGLAQYTTLKRLAEELDRVGMDLVIEARERTNG